MALVRGREEAEWHRLLEAVDPDAEVAPGLTAGDFLSFHVRPEADPPGSVFVPDVQYGLAAAEDGVTRPLWVHLYARTDVSERRPVVLFVHGGGWSGGHPFQQIRYAAACAEAGYVAGLVSYRLAGEARWPAALTDVLRAVGWARAHAGEYGGDAGRIALAGDSAGGHLALMAALGNPRWSPHDDPVDGPDALALWYPIVDLTAGERHPVLHALAVDFLGSDDPARLAEASPIEHARLIDTGDRCPPVLFQVGDRDDLTTCDSITRMATLLESIGVDVDLHVERDAGHVFDLTRANWPASRDRLLAFLARALSAGTAGPTPGRG